MSSIGHFHFSFVLSYLCSAIAHLGFRATSGFDTGQLKVQHTLSQLYMCVHHNNGWRNLALRKCLHIFIYYILLYTQPHLWQSNNVMGYGLWGHSCQLGMCHKGHCLEHTLNMDCILKWDKKGYKDRAGIIMEDIIHEIIVLLGHGVWGGWTSDISVTKFSFSSNELIVKETTSINEGSCCLYKVCLYEWMLVC